MKDSEVLALGGPWYRWDLRLDKVWSHIKGPNDPYIIYNKGLFDSSFGISIFKTSVQK